MMQQKKPSLLRLAAGSGLVLAAAALAFLALHALLPPTPPPVALTPQERAWLNAHPLIRLAPDPDFRPIEYFDGNGQYQGAAADHVRLLEQKLGIRFAIVRLKNWDQVLDAFKRHEVDLLGAAAPTPARRHYMLFTTPLVEIPGGIFVRAGSRRSLTLSELKGLKVAVVSNYLAHDYLRAERPEINLDVVPDVATGLSRVSLGVDDAYVENMANASYYLQKTGITNLRLAGYTSFTYQWGIGIRSDWPELQGILNKGVAAITADERQAIIGRWIFAGKQGWHPSRVFVASAATGLIAFIFLGVILWNQSLRRTVRNRTASLQRELEERIRIEAALRREKEVAQSYLDVAGVMLLVLNTDGAVRLINRKGCELLGYPEAEIVDRNWFATFLPLRLRGEFGALFAGIVAGGLAPPQSVENPVVTRSGTERLIRWHNSVLRDERGTIIALLSSGEDITEQRQAEEAIGKLNAELEERVEQRTAELIREIGERKAMEERIRQLNSDLERRVEERTADLQESNRELEAFCYTISHDLRAPLRAIDGAVGILLEDFPAGLDAEQELLLRSLSRSTRRMGALIDDLLEFSRLSRSDVQKSPIDMTALATEVFNDLAAGERDRHLSCTIAPLLPAAGERTMIRQVLVNLLANAIKFTATREEAVIEVGSRSGAEETTYFVRDNGVGFDMRYADKLFGVFSRLHRPQEFEGTGIGLAIVKRIVTKHGGRVWVESSVGEGATFYFSLPG